MTTSDKLELAIQKATDNGFIHHGRDGDYKILEAKCTLPGKVSIIWKSVDSDTRISETLNWEAVVYNHDFAKALWGEHTETMTVQNNTLNVKQVIDMNGWRYHLQMMVIADDPIKYLGELNPNGYDSIELDAVMEKLDSE